MELSKCMGCMEPFKGYPCPHCGYDPQRVKGTEFALPTETILAGKYLVGRVLGQGGFGITYIGWDLALERKVAIKEYFPAGQVSRNPGTKNLTWYTSENARQAQQNGMQIFLKEARKMTKVDGIPDVVRVLDLFQENGTAYIVMDFVEGETLKDRLMKMGPMPWEQAKKIFFPVIRAMEKVHQAGLIHRDLSPDNLMLTPDGGVRVLDLGAAKDLKMNSGVSSMQVAKSGFSPLEQYIQRGNSGPWTDVYALGATIYYTLTGKLPPSAVDRLNEDTISWSLPGLAALSPEALATLRRSMAIQAANRIQSMEELERGLFAVSEAPKPQASTASAAANTAPVRKLRCNKFVAAIIAAAAFFLCSSLGVSLVRSGAVGASPKNEETKSAYEASTSESVKASGASSNDPGTENAVNSDTQTPQTGKRNIMQADPVDREASEKPWEKPVFGNEAASREMICSITFLADRRQLNGETWDISEAGDGSVLACLEESKSWDGRYDLYIAADGGVEAPRDCSDLFSHYSNLKSINFNGCFDTSNVETMAGMFRSCFGLKELDLSGFNTEKVTDMSDMLYWCLGLQSVDLRSFQTRQVESYEDMFSVSGIRTLDLRGFTFAATANTTGMLANCSNLTSLRANGLVLSKVYGSYDDAAVKLGSMTGHPYTLFTKLLDCTQMTVTIDVTMNAGTKCKDWTLWGKVNGEFVEIGTIDLPNGDGTTEKTVYFNTPMTIEALMVQPKAAGGYSWSISMKVTNAHVGRN